MEEGEEPGAVQFLLSQQNNDKFSINTKNGTLDKINGYGKEHICIDTPVRSENVNMKRIHSRRAMKICLGATYTRNCWCCCIAFAMDQQYKKIWWGKNPTA
jgi:hypothetical protein